ALAEGAVKTMFLTKVWVGALVLAVVGLLAAGAGALGRRAVTAPAAEDAGKAGSSKPAAPAGAAPPRPEKLVEAPRPGDGAVRVGGARVRRSSRGRWATRRSGTAGCGKATRSRRGNCWPAWTTGWRARVLRRRRPRWRLPRPVTRPPWPPSGRRRFAASD